MSSTALYGQSETVAHLPNQIRTALNRARGSLLDPSTRNRLISTPRKSKSSRQIEIVDGDGGQLFATLIAEGKSVSFNPSQQDKSANDSALMGTEGDVEDLASARRRREVKLQTTLSTEKLTDRLLDAHLEAKTIEEEQGVSILYLALGFLKWFEAPNSDVERFAPLVLVPVTLERGTASERFKLKWTQDDPSTNLSLISMLRREHGVQLPEIDDEDELDFATYMEAAAAAVAHKDRWQVVPNDVVLGFFSFAKFLM